MSVLCSELRAVEEEGVSQQERHVNELLEAARHAAERQRGLEGRCVELMEALTADEAPMADEAPLVLEAVEVGGGADEAEGGSAGGGSAAAGRGMRTGRECECECAGRP